MQEDDGLALLKQVITQGWPGNVKEVPKELQPYWTFREKLNIEDGANLEGNKNSDSKQETWSCFEGHSWRPFRIE